MLSASSGGIFTAYALSANKLDYIERLYRNVDISKKTELFYQVFAKGLLADYINAVSGDNDNLEIPTCFTVCYIPLYSVRYYWIQGNYSRIWERYLKAAVNYPFLKFLPSVVEGRFAIDGGSADNIPLYPLLKRSRPFPEEEELDLVFVLHFDARYDYRKDFKTDVPVVDLDLSICNGFSKAHYDYSRNTISKRIELSYEYGEKIASRLFSEDHTKEEFQKIANEIFVEEHTLRQQNFSLDRLVSFLNVAGKALRNDTRCVKKLY